jgi:hypothetical protein
MKRSERYLQQARRQYGMAAMVFSGAAAAACWAPLGLLCGGGGAWASWGAGTVSLMGIAAAASLTAEGLRLQRLARIEARWEWEREVRPRL